MSPLLGDPGIPIELLAAQAILDQGNTIVPTLDIGHVDLRVGDYIVTITTDEGSVLRYKLREDR